MLVIIEDNKLYIWVVLLIVFIIGSSIAPSDTLRAISTGKGFQVSSISTSVSPMYEVQGVLSNRSYSTSISERYPRPMALHCVILRVLRTPLINSLKGGLL